jgi:AmiR/NasT family two-component response regulator
VIIEQAKGVLSIRGRVSVDDGFKVLRAYARAHNRFLAELARAVIADEDQALKVLRFGEPAP